MALRLSEINIYPIKSLGGISLTSSRVLPKGLEWDRRWMLVDDTNTFMTQRSLPVLALFKVSILNGELIVTKRENGIEVSAVRLGLDSKPSGPRIRATIWDDEVDVEEVDEELSRWFTRHIGMPCRLVAFPEANSRAVDETYRIGDDHVSLADAYPFLIIGQASLDDLNGRLAEPVPMNRFRPNFVFAGGAPFEEDEWKTFRIGTSRFVGVKPCARCVLTTVDQETAAKGVEPLATLSTFRKRENKILFGQNLIALDYGMVTVGDAIVLQ